LCLATAGYFLIAGAYAFGGGTQIKQDIEAGQTNASVISGGNGIYTVYMEDSSGSSGCGRWTALTAAMHPAGPGLNVLYGGGFPGTSDTTFRSYTTGIDYRTGLSGTCTGICSVSGSPAVTPIMNGATTVGYEFAWTIADGGNSVTFIQHVAVVGPVNGTETVDNTVIRETHTIINNGPGMLSYGLRKHWDWQIGPNDGPWFGDCDTVTAACEQSMNLTPDGSQSGMYPQSYVMNEDPAAGLCPPPTVSGIPAGCSGTPLYIVAGTVEPPSNLVPPPDAPDLLQFNSWPTLVSTCWHPGLANNAFCGGGDTSIGYFYGLTAPLSLPMGGQRSFTQYVVAGEETCPKAITPGACCNDATGVCTIETEDACTALGYRYGGDGTACEDLVPPCEAAEACCLADGTCVSLDASACTAQGGAPQGAGAVCTGAQACCFGAGTCLNLDPLCCVEEGGSPLGPGTSCSLEVACCLGDGSCANLLRECCLAIDGTPGAPGSSCAPDRACCLPSGTCIIENPACCAEQGGTPGAAGSTCTPTVACCAADDSCTDLAGACCLLSGGEVGEVGSACAGDANDDGMDDFCSPPGGEKTIPTASAWGLLVLTLCLLAGGKVFYGQRRRIANS